jgi:hypothetical protein
MLILLLASPILFPWYLLWLLPVAWLLIPLGEVPLATTVVLTAVASISETVPRTGPGMWRSIETIERFIFGPMLTLLLAWAVSDLFERRNRTGVRGRLP